MERSMPPDVRPEPASPPARDEPWVLASTAPEWRRAVSRVGRVVALVGLVIALVAGGVFYFSSRPSGEALALEFKEGAKYRYRLEMTMDGTAAVAGSTRPFSMELGETLVMRVVSVDADGWATMDLTVKDLTATVNGQSSVAPGKFTMRVRMAPDGRVVVAGGLALGASGSSGTGLPGTDQFAPLLPDHPVRPGDSWSKEFEQEWPFGDGALRISSDNRFLGYETVDGARVAVIASRLTVPLDLELELRKLFEFLGTAPQGLPLESDPTIVYGGELSMDGTGWVALETGEFVRQTATGTLDLTIRFEGLPQGPGPADAEVRLTGDFRMRVEPLS